MDIIVRKHTELYVYSAVVARILFTITSTRPITAGHVLPLVTPPAREQGLLTQTKEPDSLLQRQYTKPTAHHIFFTGRAAHLACYPAFLISCWQNHIGSGLVRACAISNSNAVTLPWHRHGRYPEVAAVQRIRRPPMHRLMPDQTFPNHQPAALGARESSVATFLTSPYVSFLVVSKH